MFYFMLDAHLFLRSQLVPHREQSQYVIKEKPDKMAAEVWLTH